MDAAKLLDFFNFFDETPTKSRPREHGSPSDGGKEGWKSGSAATSPMSSTVCSPTPELHTPPPRRTPLQVPEARPSEVCPVEGVRKRLSVRKRRSSVFFQLSEMGKVRNSAVVVADREKRQQQNASIQNDTLLSPSNRCSSSSKTGVAAGNLSPNSVRPPKKALDLELKAEKKTEAAATPTAGAAAIDATILDREAERSIQHGSSVSLATPAQRKGRRSKAYGESPYANRDGFSSTTHARKGMKTSPRALSDGHRRESCRDGGFRRPPDLGLNAEKLLLDAQDVARIRSDGGLRASFQGVCWIASSWCVGDRKGVLSGRRYLVLCDKILWVELCEAGGRDSVTSKTDGDEEGRKQAGFLPVISMDGAIVHHCEVATSNNGWVIEVVNPTTNTTLWLDPTNPTGLLRWGSVLCQAVVDERGYEIDD